MIVNMQATASSMVEIAQIVPERSRWYCDQLERGKILFFAGIPLSLHAGLFLGAPAGALHERPGNSMLIPSRITRSELPVINLNFLLHKAKR